MEIIIGCAEVALAGVGQRLAREHPPVIPAPDYDRTRPHSEATKRFLESEPIEDSRRVGTYLDAGADFAEFGGLLEDLNLEARALKRQRGCEAANPGSDYDDSHFISSFRIFVPWKRCSRSAGSRPQMLPESWRLGGDEAFQRRHCGRYSVSEHLWIAEVFCVVEVQPFSLLVLLIDFLLPQDMAILVFDQLQLHIERILDRA